VQKAMTKSTLEQMARLVGKWEMSSRRYPEGRGTMTAERLEGGAFLRLLDEAEQSIFPASTWIIGGDDSSEDCEALYHDSRGVSRIYQTTLNKDVWKIWRNAPGFNQRFTGTLIDGGNTVVGEWELSRDGSSWETTST
jgi:hypothetical protein